MKRYVSFILIVALLTSAFSLFSVNVGASFPETSSMDGYGNLCLTYTWNPGRADNGRHAVEDLMPYVAYLDKNGNIQDFFFDSYLFLPCVKLGATGASMHYDYYKPTKALDWTSYVEDTFYDGMNVDALEEAFGRTKEALNAPDKKAGVFFSILYPAASAGANFGSLGGKELDFSNIEDRKYAIKWIIDEQVRLYTEAGYENLDLLGFYWLEEYVNTSSDKELFNYASEYLHSLGLKFLWIPYYRANGYSTWKELGFDIACMQPNMYWDTSLNKSRVDSCVDQCDALDMCVEIEIDNRALSNSKYFNRYLDYLEGCMQGGAIDSIKMYYQDGKNAVFYNACYSYEERTRSIYDLTYKYAKGTLTQEDIDDNRVEPITLPDDVEWVSIGKDYVATKPYSDGGEADYQKNDGKELTDGVIGSSELGTEWHAYHVSQLDDDERMSVTIDLGSVRDDLTDFLIQFSHVENYGIGDPADDIKIYVSDDGNKFELLAEPKLGYIDSSAYVYYISTPVTARYVKYSFINSDANFVFCSEALVGVSDNYKDVYISGTNVALGKKYVGGEVSPVGPNYSANLTDGIVSALGSFDSNWYAFYYNKTAAANSITAPDGIGTIVIDLEDVVGGITNVRAHVWNCNSAGVLPAKSITLFVSEDGKTYKKVGELAIPEGDNPAWATISTDNISARYVILVFETQGTWTFLNEIEVYGDAPEGKLGDIDADGDVDVADYILVKRAVLKNYTLSTAQSAVADIDKDGDVDAADYVLVKRMVLGTYSA